MPRLFDTGLCVKSVIFDQGASNQKLEKLLDETGNGIFCHDDNSPSFEYLCIMTDIFKRLKIQGSRGATPCITGWQLSISAVIALWNDVKSVCGVKYLCTRKSNQDPLENCFSFIRAKGGFSANPDPKQLHTNKC